MKSSRTAISKRSVGLAGLGHTLLHHWEVPLSSSPLITITSGRITQLNDRVGSTHLSEVSSNGPAPNDTGGPGNGPHIAVSDTGYLRATGLGIAAANRVCIYAVCAVADHNANNIPWDATDSAGSGEVVTLLRDGATSKFQGWFDFTGGSQAPVASTSPAFDTGWHFHAFMPRPSGEGGAKWEIDGVAAVSNFTGSDTVKAIDRFYFGYPGAAGGKMALAVMVNDTSRYSYEVVKQYVRQRYGLVIA